MTERDLARTFDGGSHADVWEIVEQYRDARRYASRHDVGSSATAFAPDFPRSTLDFGRSSDRVLDGVFDQSTLLERRSRLLSEEILELLEGESA